LLSPNKIARGGAGADYSMNQSIWEEKNIDFEEYNLIWGFYSQGVS
jgi:hypothetical protein